MRVLQRRGLPRLVIVALIEQLRIEVATPANQTYVTTLERLRRYRRESEFVERYDLTARLDLVVAMADARVALCLRDDVAAAVLDFARSMNGTQVVVGASRRNRAWNDGSRARSGRRIFTATRRPSRRSLRQRIWVGIGCWRTAALSRLR